MVYPNLIIIQLQIQVVQFNQITNYLMPNMESKWEYPMGDVTMPKLVWMWIGMKIRWTIHALIPQPLSFLMRLWNLYYIVIMYQKIFYQVRTKKITNRYFFFFGIKKMYFISEHHCMNEKINYKELLPTYGNHRPLWPKYGEYRSVNLFLLLNFRSEFK